MLERMHMGFPELRMFFKKLKMKSVRLNYPFFGSCDLWPQKHKHGDFRLWLLLYFPALQGCLGFASMIGQTVLNPALEVIVSAKDKASLA